MGYVNFYMPHSKSWAAPVPTGQLSGFFHNPDLYLRMMQGDDASRGEVSWRSAKRLAMVIDDEPWVADRLFVGRPLPEITIPKEPESKDVLPSISLYGNPEDLSSLDDVVPQNAHLVGLKFARMLGLYKEAVTAVDEFEPTDDIVSDAGMVHGLTLTLAELRAEVIPPRLLAQRIISQRSQSRMSNIPLSPMPEDVQLIRGVMKSALTEETLHFVQGSTSIYEKLAETMWFSMLWQGFSKFDADRQADIKVVMESLEDELHDRLTAAVNELNAPLLDRKLVAAATLAVVHPSAFMVDMKILKKAVQGLVQMTAHQNADVSHNASHMLVRLIKHAGAVYPNVIADALYSMKGFDNPKVAFVARDMSVALMQQRLQSVREKLSLVQNLARERLQANP